MPPRVITFSELVKRSAVHSHGECQIKLKKIKVHILEMEDALFHLNSCVLMPENPAGVSSTDGGGANAEQLTATGIKALALIYKQFEFDPEKRMVIAGHTDTSGGAEDNFLLSEQRAQNVLYLLINDKDNWATVSETRHRVEDYQQILKYFSTERKWMCNPGKVDNKWGPKTEAATGRFILSYNMNYANQKNLPRLDVNLCAEIGKDPNHKWPKKLWEVVFHLYRDTLVKTAGSTPDVKFVSDDKKYVACGESFPIKDADKENYRSQANRRVEILLFDKGEEPNLNCPVDVTEVHKEKDCPLWHGYHFEPVYIDPADLHSVMYHLVFRYFDRVGNAVKDVPAGLESLFKAYMDDGVNRETLTELTTSAEFKKSGDNGIYHVKVRFPSDPKDHKQKHIHFEFKTNTADNKTKMWIYTKDGSTDPKIVTPSDDDKKKWKDLKERIKYYDLPPHWSSRNYWTRTGRTSNDGKLFDETIKAYKPAKDKKTAPDKPLIFSLDDIVLLNSRGTQTIKDKEVTTTLVDDSPWNKILDGHNHHLRHGGNLLYYKKYNFTEADKALQNGSRYALFAVKNTELVLHDPQVIGGRTYNFTDASFNSNLITNIPADGAARVVIFCNQFYAINDQRAIKWNDLTDPFDPAKHVIGCRAAEVVDTNQHKHLEFRYPNVPANHDFKYFATLCGHFELHYVHDGCVISGHKDNLKRRSFLIVYWNGYFYSHPGFPISAGDIDTAAQNAATHYGTTKILPVEVRGASANEVRDFETQGPINAKQRWEAKGYTLEPVDKPTKAGDCDIEIKPVFHFEAKINMLGGVPKCQVRVSRETSHGEMGVRDSKMHHNARDVKTGYAVNRDEYGERPIDAVNGLRTPMSLTVAHELGHATGKMDEYEYDNRFNQYYPGMPYHKDVGSMMNCNRATRLKQIWGFTNWVNDASRPTQQAENPEIPAGPMSKLLDGTQFKIVYRFQKDGRDKHLHYHLDDDYRNFTKPFFNTDNHVLSNSGQIDLSAYKLGDDEAAYNITISDSPNPPSVFQGTVVVYLKVSCTFVNHGTNNWNNAADKTNWMNAIKQQINNFNNHFYLQNTSAKEKSDFNNTYILFFPVFLENTANAHFNIEVTRNDTSDITEKNGATLKVGNNVSPVWVARYLLGTDDNVVKAFFKKLFSVSEKLSRDQIKFVEKWFKDSMAAKLTARKQDFKTRIDRLNQKLQALSKADADYAEKSSAINKEIKALEARQKTLPDRLNNRFSLKGNLP